MVENPGKVATKFQFSSLLNKAWFQSIQPETIKSGFRKAKIYPFDATAIKPITASQVMVSAKDPTSIDTATQEAVEKLDESSSSTATSCKENISFTEDQVTLFQKRYDNGYNLYHDDIYVAWLQQEHPESLPDDIVIPDTSPVSSVTENINTIVKSQNDSCTELQNLSENSDNFSVQESSDISDLDVQAPTKSLSVSLSQTRSLLSELSEFLNHPKEPVKAKGKKSAARVLTSAESLSLLIEKEKKKREEEEAKEKRKEE